MKKLYISSYYQSQLDPVDLTTVPTEYNRKQVESLLSELIKDNVIQVSAENLRKIEHLRQSLSYNYNFLNALSCDLEVAIQEKKLFKLAKQLGYEVHDRTPIRPNFTYLEDYSLEHIELKTEELFTGDIYIVNTHGRKDGIDGPYEQAICNSLNIQRILIDACSSAAESMPAKNNKNRSVIEKVADECIDMNKDNNLEIIGYKNDYSTEEFYLTARAAFAIREVIAEYDLLKLITVQDRKAQHTDMEHLAREQRLKLIAETKESFTPDALKRSLITLCSKLSSKYLYDYLQEHLKGNYKAHQESPILKFLIDIITAATGKENYLQTLIEGTNGGKIHYKAILENIKEQRKTYFNQCPPDVLIELAQQAKKISDHLEQNDKDILSSIAMLSRLIDVLKLPEQNKNAQYGRFFIYIDNSSLEGNTAVDLPQKIEYKVIT
ncbi:MAG: hypothetical protein QM652_00520 [Legionella sp.]|uniref:hypothetical protein n=1 Tax=Legionella sp. TaxID=459 RepID=UPI0039E4174E